MALDAGQEALYVADTGNHTIRRIDLRDQRITTVAGTGAQGLRRSLPGAMRLARETALNSPWDLCLLDGKLYIAMAGPHQIWVYDPATEAIGVLAGSGAEGRADGVPTQAAFAQPSGIATDGRRLYVADSEISCVRAIDLEDGQPHTCTLAGGDLFQFGDRDGRGDLARLQHPLGVAWIPDGEPGGGFLYVADTYNHKIKRLDTETRDLTGFAGAGSAGSKDGASSEAQFAEPGGLSYARGALYVADTNNHAVRVITLPDGQVTTLHVTGLCAPNLCLPG
jgi:sugar lactone lactonase YvrE